MRMNMQTCITSMQTGAYYDDYLASQIICHQARYESTNLLLLMQRVVVHFHQKTLETRSTRAPFKQVMELHTLLWACHTGPTCKSGSFSLHDDIETFQTLLSVDSAVLILSASPHALMQLA